MPHSLEVEGMRRRSVDQNFARTLMCTFSDIELQKCSIGVGGKWKWRKGEGGEGVEEWVHGQILRNTWI